MKKKILAVISAAAMALSFSACTSSEDVENAINGGNNNISTENNNNNNNNNNSSNKTEEEEKKTEEEKTEPENNNQKAAFQHGKNTDSGYKSSFFNIEIEYGDDWTYYDDDYLASQNGADDMSDESINEVLDKNAVIYEMMASLPSNSNINIVVENLNITNGGKSLTGEEYLNLAFPNLKSTIVSSYEDASAEISTTTICGKEMPCVKVEISSDGLTANEVLVAVPGGNYMATVTITFIGEEDFNTIASAIKSIG